MERDIKIMSYQICPKCQGEGKVFEMGGTMPTGECPVCRGRMIIDESTGYPPQTEKDKYKVTFREKK